MFAVFLDFFCLSPTKTGWRQSLENRGTILGLNKSTNYYQRHRGWKSGSLNDKRTLKPGNLVLDMLFS
jgi:hypothetical protein